jgi:thiol-disulfide isomerase/thioredoxin
MRKPILIVLGCLVAGAAGVFAYRNLVPASAMPASAVPAAARQMQLPDVHLTGLDGREHAFTEWRGKLLLVNFWATWCAPCLKEIPELAKAQAAYASRGLQIVGPAVDDPEAVKAMLKPLGINYPVLTAAMPDTLLKLMDTLGNGPGGLPFSVLVATDGSVISQQLGEFTPEELHALLEAHLGR